MSQPIVSEQPKGFPGQLVGGLYTHKTRSMVNDKGAKPKVVDVLITAANGTAYSYTVVGRVLNYTSSAAATKAEIRDAFVALMRADPIIMARVAPNPSGDNIRHTAKTPGDDFPLVESDVNLATTTVQANVTPEAIPMGRAVVRNASGSSDKSAMLPTGTGQAFAGVVQRVHSNVDPSNANSDEVTPGSDMTVVYEGMVLVEVDQAVAPGDPAYFRFSASATEKIGVWRKDDDTTPDADLVPGAVFESTAGVGEVAVLSLNTP